VDLNELAVIYTAINLCAYGVVIGAQAVCGELESVLAGGVRQFAHESSSGAHCALPEIISEYKLGVAFDCDKNPRVSDIGKIRFITAPVTFLLLDESPDFVALNICDFDVLNVRSDSSRSQRSPGAKTDCMISR
jgi:hypothetical protein